VLLEQDRYRLGRSSVNDLSFPEDGRLSREHLVFERTVDGWTVQDLHSRNGTRINGLNSAERTPLRDGDRISAGNLSIQFSRKAGSRSAAQHRVVFLDEALTGPIPPDTISVDLKTALESSTDTTRGPALEHVHITALLRAGRELASHCPLNELFHTILNLSLDAVKASRGALMTLEGGVLKLEASRGEGIGISTAVRDRVLAGQSILVRDARLSDFLAHRYSIQIQEIRSVLAVPLQTDHQVIGLIYLDSPHLIREFTADDLNVLTVLANVAAIRIEHARLLEVEQAEKLMARELEQAAAIQRRLLPAGAPNVAGFDIAGYNAACRKVGGDYYDFLPYAGNRLAVLVADVSGKGMPASLLMSNLQARTQVIFDGTDTLALEVSRLNRATALNTPAHSFVTFVIGVLDPAKGEFTYCNAGHNAPLLLRADGKVERLSPTGTVLGLFPEAGYEQESCHLQPGDTLVLFSDGVTEAPRLGDGLEFGEDRLLDLVRARRHESAVQIAKRIETELFSFTAGAPLTDDATFVLVRRV
jgi:serine phosphatase RsbU (regulator of sigma subunit)